MKWKSQLSLYATCLLVSLTMQSYGQFGVSIEYQSLNSQHWTDVLTSADGVFSDQLVGISAFYWWRLKDKRVEFLPEVGYAFSLGETGVLTTGLNRLSVALNTDIYLFDLLNDCDCPTFSKQGGFFQRSFFFEVSPGLDFQMLSLNDESDLNRSYDDNALSFRLGLGVGFDIGISDLLTITPLVGMDYSTRPDWSNLEQTLGLETTDATGGEWLFHAGVRVLFRPDYKRRYR